MLKYKKDLIPESFILPEEAGNFWDTHSLADYEKQTKTVEIDFRDLGKSCIPGVSIQPSATRRPGEIV